MTNLQHKYMHCKLKRVISSLFCLQVKAANGKVAVFAGGGGGHEPFAAGKLQIEKDIRLAREKQLFVHDSYFLSRFA